jgi:hypothetical protein
MGILILSHTIWLDTFPLKVVLTNLHGDGFAQREIGVEKAPNSDARKDEQCEGEFRMPLACQS